MKGEIASFNLSSFDEFVSSYQNTTSLAPEALDAFDKFLPALDKFFDLMDSVEVDTNDSIVLIKWYGSAVISSGDTIHANSNWYHQPIFDNVSINMDENESEEYTTYDGICFGKVRFWL